MLHISLARPYLDVAESCCVGAPMIGVAIVPIRGDHNWSVSPSGHCPSSRLASSSHPVLDAVVGVHQAAAAHYTLLLWNIVGFTK